MNCLLWIPLQLRCTSLHLITPCLLARCDRVGLTAGEALQLLGRAKGPHQASDIMYAIKRSDQGLGLTMTGGVGSEEVRGFGVMNGL